MVDDRPLRTDPEEPRGTAEGPSGNRGTVLLLAGFTALVVLAIGIFAILVATTGDNFTLNDAGLLPVDSQAPGFTTQTVNGGSVSLADTRGARATMLVFFATWRPECNEEAPILSDLQSEYEELRVIMLGVDDEDDQARVREFVDRYGIEGPAAYDPSLAPIYQVSGYPAIYVVDEDQNIVAAHTGEVPRDVLENWIGDALGG